MLVWQGMSHPKLFVLPLGVDWILLPKAKRETDLSQQQLCGLAGLLQDNP